jgi:hypothetical protein
VSEAINRRAKWQHFRKRSWDEIRKSWLENIPAFPSRGAKPDPGLEKLPALLALETTAIPTVFPDLEGLRPNALWEAVFLFQKCAYAHLAAQRIGQEGMHCWSLFNAYHSAYLGAKGMMTLLGAPCPNVAGTQLALDLFPEPATKKRGLSTPYFSEFKPIRLPRLEQRNVWEGFQRLLNISEAKCWNLPLRDELLNLSHDAISPPRNHFLYKAAFWPIPDLIDDLLPADLTKLYEGELDPEEVGFLIRLSCSVYLLFEQLLSDLANDSEAIRDQMEGSRILANAGQPVLQDYATFVLQVSNVV